MYSYRTLRREFCYLKTNFRRSKLFRSMQNLILHRTVIFLLTGKRLVKISPQSFFSQVHMHVFISDIEERILLPQNEFPSIKIIPFYAEFNSTSNGDIFIDGKTFGQNFTSVFFFS